MTDEGCLSSGWENEEVSFLNRLRQGRDADTRGKEMKLKWGEGENGKEMKKIR
jgi:hypothetical protein